MKYIATAIAGLTISSFAFGSYMERCNFNGDLETKSSFELGQQKQNEDLSGVALFKIKSAVDQGSHNPDACESHVGETVVFNVENRVKYFGMKEADVSYVYINSRGPNGVISSTRYDIINNRVFSDALEVSDLKTSVINKMPRIGIPGQQVTRSTTSRLLFNAVVISTGCTNADSFKAKIVKDSKGQQVLSIERVGFDMCEVTPHEETIEMEATGFDYSQRQIIYNDQIKEVYAQVVY